MRVKKFVAPTMTDAVARMKKEFGKDAIVLHTKRIRRGGLFGFFGRLQVEVIGAIDVQAVQAASSKRKEQSQRPLEREAAAARGHLDGKQQGSSEEVGVSLAPGFGSSVEANSSINEDLTDSDTSAWPQRIQQTYHKLRERDIPHDVARSLIKKAVASLPKKNVLSSEELWSVLTRLVSESLDTVEPWDLSQQRRTVALIGPTGVGKTTTLGKLAANFSLIAGRSVGLITVDTYRIAAIDQLRTYAGIIGVPLQVVYTAEELNKALARMEDKELVLIDTAGRSPRNPLQMAELKAFFAGLDVEFHLVISATTKETDVRDIAALFGDMPFHRLIITKLDETSTYGLLLTIPHCVEAPISFVTTGQGVPEDIEVAEAERLADMIMGD